MRLLAGYVGAALVLFILWDAFESIVLPRRVTRRFRITRLFYRVTWLPWWLFARRLRPGKPRQALLSAFGPLSLILLLASWALALIFGFALIHVAAGTVSAAPLSTGNFWPSLYMSGSTFFTLGLGDVTPHTTSGRVITVFESGVGFGFLAIVIGYLPVIYNAFSRRETNISLLDARAGSPPTARELIARYGRQENVALLAGFLHDWEAWTAELMESHLSYPVLCYYRSQHDNQSWLAALTAILDACALLVTYVEGEVAWQARLTFAIARHAVVDICQVLNVAPIPPREDRLPSADLAAIRRELAEAGMTLCDRETAERGLTEHRRMYEPYVNALAARLLMPIPSWTGTSRAANWQTSAWEKVSAGASADEAGAATPADEEHV